MENIISRFFGHKKPEQHGEQPLAYFRGYIRQSPTYEQYAQRDLQYADPAVLKELSESKDRSQMRKFVREEERIALDPEGIEHATIAKAAGMKRIHDAGTLIGGNGRLFITGGSMGFNIEGNNPNRGVTIRILQQIAPTIPLNIG